MASHSGQPRNPIRRDSFFLFLLRHASSFFTFLFSGLYLRLLCFFVLFASFSSSTFRAFLLLFSFAFEFSDFGISGNEPLPIPLEDVSDEDPTSLPRPSMPTPTTTSSAPLPEKRPTAPEQPIQPLPQKRRKTVAIRIRSTPPQSSEPAEGSSAKDLRIDVSAEMEKSTPHIPVDSTFPEVTPQPVQIDSSSSHSSTESSPLLTAKHISSQKTSPACFTSSLRQEMSDIGRQTRREARLDKKREAERKRAEVTMGDREKKKGMLKKTGTDM